MLEVRMRGSGWNLLLDFRIILIKILELHRICKPTYQRKKVANLETNRYDFSELLPQSSRLPMGVPCAYACS